MSRLYTKVTGDKAKHPATQCAFTETETVILWGSVSSPKKAVTVRVNWERGSEFPVVNITLGRGVMSCAEDANGVPIILLPMPSAPPTD